MTNAALLERSLGEELSVLDVIDDLVWHRDGDITVVYRIAAFHEPSLDDDAMNASAFLAENAWSALPEGTRYQFFVLLDRAAAKRSLEAALPPIAAASGASELLDEMRRYRLAEITRGEEALQAQDRRHYLAATFRPSCFHRSRFEALSRPLRAALSRLRRRKVFSSEEALRRDVILEASHFERRVARSLSSREGLELHRCRTPEIVAFIHELLSPTSAAVQPLRSLRSLPPAAGGVQGEPGVSALLDDDLFVSRTHLIVGDHAVGILSMKDLPDRTEPGLLVPLLRLGRDRYRLMYGVDIAQRSGEISALRRKQALAEGLRHTTVVESARTDPHADAVSAQSTEAMRRIFSSTQRLFGTSLQLVFMERSVEALDEAMQEGISAMAVLQGMRGYRETFLLRKLFLSQVPGAPAVAERQRKALTPVMVDMQPVFDFRSGDATRGVPFVTRDRATIFYDPFDARAQANANVLVTGTSGAGKSVAVQMLLSGYEMMAACHGHPPPQVFIIDNGASYRRYMDLRPEDGRYVAFSFAEPPGCDIFAFDPSQEDRDEHVGRLQWLLVDLLRLDADKEADFEAKNALLERALIELYPAEGGSHTERSFAGLVDALGPSSTGRLLAERLRTFVDGKFARLFEPNARLALGEGVRAVCYDFQLLSEHPDLALIALRLVIYEIRRRAARNHRLSDRCGRSFLVLDESWALLDAGTGGAMTQMAAPFIAASVRMGRKEGLSTIALSQQVEDFAQSGYGAAILGNSATKLVGRPGKEGVEGIRKHVQLSDRQVEQVRRLVCTDRYHEFLLTQGDVTNVVRIALDPLSRWIFTTSPADRERIDATLRGRPDLDLGGVIRLLAHESEVSS